MKSKTKISKQLERKTNPELVETILAAKKNSAWLEVASLLSSPKRVNVNLDKIGEAKEDKIVIPGKILSQGNVNKKMKVIAMSFSGKAREKLLKAGCEVKTILEEIKFNPEAKDVKVLK